MGGLWQGGRYVLQSTIEERYRELEAERDRLREENKRLKKALDYVSTVKLSMYDQLEIKQIMGGKFRLTVKED
jgi:hypothetical protein